MKRRFTIERITAPTSRRRYLIERRNGLGWAGADRDVLVFKSAAAACWYFDRRTDLEPSAVTIVAHLVH